MNYYREEEFQNYEDLKKSFVSGRMGKNSVNVEIKKTKKSNKNLMPSLKKTKEKPMKYLTFEELKKYNTSTGSFGVEPLKIEKDTELRNSSFRDSGRPYETNYMSKGYKGPGAESGDISISTELRSENVRTLKSKNNDLDSKDDNLSHRVVSSYSKLMNIYSNNLNNRGGIISRDDSRMD